MFIQMKHIVMTDHGFKLLRFKRYIYLFIIIIFTLSVRAELMALCSVKWQI